jgi:hypothetical protein
MRPLLQFSLGLLKVALGARRQHACVAQVGIVVIAWRRVIASQREDQLGVLHQLVVE